MYIVYTCAKASSFNLKKNYNEHRAIASLVI